jgi:transposase InsO family protein
MEMTMKSRQELTGVTSRRYRKAPRLVKSRILNEFIAATGYNRGYGATLLRNYGKSKKILAQGKPLKITTTKKRRKPGGRPRVYGNSEARILAILWKKLGYLCGKRLAVVLRATVVNMVGDPFLKITPEIAEALTRMSPATIDRLLSPMRKKLELKGKSYTRSTSRLADQIPVRTFAEWTDVDPGHFQLDLVGHEGGVSSGEFAFSLVITDVCTGWTERRAVKNRAARWIKEAIEEVRGALPFAIIELHPDNGSEFINLSLLTYCRESGVRLSRSRPYRKNDNCYVEQKNFDTVRKIVGYARYDTPEALEVINQLYRIHSLLQNYVYPSQKLIEKTRHGSKVTRRHESPKTPAQRYLDHPKASTAEKQKIRKRLKSINPLVLAADVDQLQEKLFELATKPKTKIQQLG